MRRWWMVGGLMVDGEGETNLIEAAKTNMKAKQEADSKGADGQNQQSTRI